MNGPLEKFLTNSHNFKHAPKCHLLLKVLNMSFQPTPKKTALKRSDGIRTKKDLSGQNQFNQRHNKRNSRPIKRESGRAPVKIIRHTKSVSQQADRAYRFE